MNTLIWGKGALRVGQECVNPASTYGVSKVMVRSIFGASKGYNRSVIRLTRPKITIQVNA